MAIMKGLKDPEIIKLLLDNCHSNDINPILDIALENSQFSLFESYFTNEDKSLILKYLQQLLKNGTYDSFKSNFERYRNDIDFNDLLFANLNYNQETFKKILLIFSFYEYKVKDFVDFFKKSISLHGNFLCIYIFHIFCDQYLQNKIQLNYLEELISFSKHTLGHADNKFKMLTDMLLKKNIFIKNDSQSDLLEAVNKSRYYDVNLLLKQNAVITDAILVSAIINADTRLFSFLMQQPVNLSAMPSLVALMEAKTSYTVEKKLLALIDKFSIVDIDCKNHKGLGLLDYAIQNKDESLFKLLVQLGIKLDYQGPNNLSPLQQVENLLSSILNSDRDSDEDYADSDECKLNNIKNILEKKLSFQLSQGKLDFNQAVSCNLTQQAYKIFQDNPQLTETLSKNEHEAIGLINQTITQGNVIILRLLLTAGADVHLNINNVIILLMALTSLFQDFSDELCQTIAKAFLEKVSHNSPNSGIYLSLLVSTLLKSYFICPNTVKMVINKLANQQLLDKGILKNYLGFELQKRLNDIIKVENPVGENYSNSVFFQNPSPLIAKKQKSAAESEIKTNLEMTVNKL